MMKKKGIVKRYITLIEILIVITLIGLIAGALAYNMGGAITKGKIFATEERMKKIEEILVLESATGDRSLEDLIGSDRGLSTMQTSTHRYLIKTPLEKLLNDSWNTPFEVEIVIYENGEPGILAWSNLYGRKKYSLDSDDANKRKYMEEHNMMPED